MDDKQKFNQNKTPVSNQNSVVGLPNKEVETVVVTAPASEFIKPEHQDTQPTIDKDLAELGVEAKNDDLKLTEEHKKIGIQNAKESTPLAAASNGISQMPMTQAQAVTASKTGSANDSIKWLASLIVKVLNVMGLKN